MRYRVVAVGAMKRGPLASAAERYATLLRGLGQLEVVEIRDRGSGGTDASKARNDVELLAHADGNVVALDERGELPTSEELAARISALETAGTSRITLLIGGPDGHGPDVRRACHWTLALSRLTLPHDLARVVLLEQLYRVESIRAGHPYHRR